MTSPLDITNAFFDGRSGRQQYEANKLIMAEREARSKNEQGINSLLAQMGNVKDKSQFVNNLAGYGTQGLDAASKVQAVWDKADQRQKAQIQEGYTRQAQLLSVVKQDPEKYGQIRQMLVQQYPEFDSVIPRQYDPTWVDAQIAQTRSVQDLFGGNGTPAGIQEFSMLTKGMTQEDIERAKRIELGLDPRATGSGAITIVNQGLTDQVAGSQAVIKGAEAGASEEAKLKEQLALKPKIQAAVKQAEEEGKARGETVTALTRAKAAMPGLLEVSQKLKQLSDIATYTTSGRLFDTAVKEMGFGATKGATARATMISIVDNQILPLLRETFGAAFTKAEGDSLRATLLDPNATPESKKATLDAFIQQKYRNIEAQEREIGSLGASPQNNAPGVVDWSNL